MLCSSSAPENDKNNYLLSLLRMGNHNMIYAKEKIQTVRDRNVFEQIWCNGAISHCKLNISQSNYSSTVDQTTTAYISINYKCMQFQF